MTQAGRNWSRRLRQVLRKELEAQGLGSVPRDLNIRFHPPREAGAMPSIELRHSPGPTERMSVHDHVGDFQWSEEALDRFREAGVMHVRRILRRNARLAALLAAGHSPRKPPLHALEADPLTALAMRLRREGLAGISGEIGNDNGILMIDNLTISMPGTGFHIVKPGYARLEIWGSLPEAIIGVIEGRRLGDVIDLPLCHDQAIDAAVRDMRILRAANRWGGNEDVMTLTLDRAEVVEIEATPASEDGSWKALQPRPCA